ncbi:MAG: amylo-alpha-1,6-glucosidase [Candidatus Sumerlaeaceae bacterium]
MSINTDLPDSLELIEVDAAELLGYTRVSSKPGNPQVNNLVLKEKNIFFLTDQKGNVPQGEQCHLGLYSEDTRFLSRWELQVMGQEPTVLSSQANRVFCDQIDLTTSFTEGAKDIYEHNFLHLRRRQAVSDKLIERVRISNYLNVRQQITFTIYFAADFADMFEVRGAERDRRGTYFKPIVEHDRVALCYRGLDSVLRTTRIVFNTAPTQLTDHFAEFNIAIPPGGNFLLEMHVVPLIGGACDEVHLVSFSEVYKEISEDYAKWRNTCTRIDSDNEFLTTSLSQSITDLRALMISYDGHAIISAGIPWYSTPFGRDSLITSLQTLMINPEIAQDTLLFLAHYQGTRTNDFTVEEPGKILHEIRRGEMARCGEIPHVPYFGTVDATPLFLVLLHAYFAWTNDLELVRKLLPNAEMALRWIDTYGDVDGDGFVEYWNYTERGCLHQGWKDSVDGVIFPDGTQPQLPIALVEVQGYVYDAKLGMSRIYRALGQADKSRKLREEAETLKALIEDRFWIKSEKFYALALDGRKRPMHSVTSNPAHLLMCNVVSQAAAQRVERRLMADDMYSGWGIRTFSARHSAYNPLSYHNGSVWPHDNAMAMLGLCNYNLKQSAERTFSDIYSACLHFQYYRLPELYCGMTRQPNDSPVHYPVACTPQAWAAATFPMMLQGLIGIRPDAPRGRLTISNPRLPHVLGELTIHNMRVGNGRVTLHIARQNERTFVNVVEHSGDPIRVTIEWD